MSIKVLKLSNQERSRADPTLLNDFEMAAEGNGDLPVCDLRTMEELCQPSLNGRGGPIAPIAIQATNFGLKNDMIQQSIKINGVTDDALRRYLFPHSLTHHATAWFDRLPRSSINTFEQMAKMFLGKYFPHSMVTKLRNKITSFRQRPDELLFEAWERYKLSIDRCPNHNMLPVTQIDTFYNGLTLRRPDTINVAAGGSFMKRRLDECYDLIENMIAHHNDWDTSAQRSESSSSITSSFDTEITALKAEMAEINKNLMRVLQVNQQVKVVTPNCETCGGPHSYTDCPATVGKTQNVYAVGVYQGNSYQPQGNRNLLSHRSDNYLGPPRSRADPTLLNDFEMAAEGNSDLPVCDLRTIEELCQPSLNGRGGPIAPIAIQATNFGLKNDMIQQVQNSCQFHGLPAWERYKLSIDQCPNYNMLPVTQIDTFYNGLTLRRRDTINVAAGGSFMKRRPDECYDLIENMIAYHNDWDTSAQRSESSSSITSSFDTEITALKTEMAEINKNLMRVLQVNQQVKVVTPNCETCGGPHSYTVCPATVGKTQNVYAVGVYQGDSYQPQGNRNLLSHRSDNYLGPPRFNQNQNRNNQNQNFHNQNRNQGNHHPQGNNQGKNQFFQGASHGQNPPPAYQAPAYQAPVHQPQIPQPQVVTTNEFTNFMKANDVILKNMQTNMTSLTNSNLELKNMFSQFIKMNTASSSGSRTLPGNTITNPKEDLKGITTRSGTSYQRPMISTISSSQPLVLECETEVTKDTVPPTNNESTKDVQPLVIQTETPILNSESVVAPIIKPVFVPVSSSKLNQKPSIPYPSRLHDQKLRDKASDQRETFLQIFEDLNFRVSFADALILMPKFGPTIKTLLTNKDKLFELARTPLNEHCSAVLLKKLPEKLGDPGKFLIPCDFLGMAECLALVDLGASINLMPLSVWKKLSFLELSSTCITLELADHSISHPVGVAEDVFVKVGTFLFLADFVVVDFDADPRDPLILERYFLKTGKSLIDVFKGEPTLRVGKEAITFNLDQTSRYSASYNDMTENQIDVIDMAYKEYSQEVLGFSDVIASSNPTPYYDPIVSTSFPTLTPFGDSDFLLEEVDAFLALEDDATLPKVDHSYFDSEGDILLLEAFLNDGPSLPPPNQRNYLPQVRKELKICEAKTN
nr:reverse transcriptase domain-containing protein [Tanacetum cinerariifolium]